MTSHDVDRKPEQAMKMAELENEFKDFGIIGEPYLSIDHKRVLYLTDTGRRWNSKFSVKDVVDANSRRKEKMKSTDDVIRLIKKGYIEQMCILAHPERWSDSFGAWLKEGGVVEREKHW